MKIINLLNEFNIINKMIELINSENYIVSYFNTIGWDVGHINFIYSKPTHNIFSYTITDFTLDKYIGETEYIKMTGANLHKYAFQREKFLNIIIAIQNNTEIFYPYESITEFKSNIGLIDILIQQLKTNMSNYSK